MTIQITITPTEKGISVSGPFSETNNKIYRQLGGKFTAGGFWLLPDNETSRTRLAELFGAKSEPVEVLIPANLVSDDSIVEYGGYVLASRKYRDYSVKLALGVSLAQGSFHSSGGSVKNPRVAHREGTVYRLVCRKSFAETYGLELAPTTPPSIEI